MLKKINKNSEVNKNLKQTTTELSQYSPEKFILAGLILKDMMFYIQIWRQIKGYSSNGQRTHSNNKNNKKNKIINTFRLQQFYKLFGRKKRDIFPTLIIAEYTNRMWCTIWHEEWVEAGKFLLYIAIKNKSVVKFDPHMLSKNLITGVRKVKKKKKHNTAKRKIVLVATIGLPVFFTRYLYGFKNLPRVPYSISIPDDSRKKMGKKNKKNKKK